jgi:HAD superfamily hydrolase (TIGR01509 family)
MPISAIFFDVGNTLLFQDYSRTLAPLYLRGIHPGQALLFSAEAAARHSVDAVVAQTGRVDQSYWTAYYAHLLWLLSVKDDALLAELIALARTSANWSRILPGTFDVLATLRHKYRLAVITNSDGRMASVLESRGFAGDFESVTDSGAVGHEKPAVEIFRAALASLGVPAEQGIYIGDIYSVDYLGARNAGMHALLMDRAGVYRATDLPRIESLAELGPALARV